jgi:DNA-binding transcriptional ArsR family regulator
MVYYSQAASPLDATFAALADPTRRAILARLASGESSIVRLAEPFSMSLPAILKHVHVLEDAGLLARRKQGRVNHCRLLAEPMRDAAEWVARYRNFWEDQFDSLARYLEITQSEEKSSWQQRNRARSRASKSAAPSPRRAKKSSTRGPTAKR